MKNLFDIKDLEGKQGELFESLLEKGDLRVERIVTLTSYAEPGEWYDQETDEWVVLLKGSAEIEYKAGTKTRLEAGDHLFIPARRVHRVAWSSPDEICIWLAVHGNFKDFQKRVCINKKKA